MIKVWFHGGYLQGIPLVSFFAVIHMVVFVSGLHLVAQSFNGKTETCVWNCIRFLTLFGTCLNCHLPTVLEIVKCQVRYHWYHHLAHPSSSPQWIIWRPDIAVGVNYTHFRFRWTTKVNRKIFLAAHCIILYPSFPDSFKQNSPILDLGLLPLCGLPSGKHTKSYWKWLDIVDLPIKHGVFSIVMLVYQRVSY